MVYFHAVERLQIIIKSPSEGDLHVALSVVIDSLISISHWYINLRKT